MGVAGSTFTADDAEVRALRARAEAVLGSRLDHVHDRFALQSIVASVQPPPLATSHDDDDSDTSGDDYDDYDDDDDENEPVTTRAPSWDHAPWPTPRPMPKPAPSWDHAPTPVPTAETVPERDPTPRVHRQKSSELQELLREIDEIDPDFRAGIRHAALSLQEVRAHRDALRTLKREFRDKGMPVSRWHHYLIGFRRAHGFAPIPTTRAAMIEAAKDISDRLQREYRERTGGGGGTAAPRKPSPMAVLLQELEGLDADYWQRVKETSPDMADLTRHVQAMKALNEQYGPGDVPPGQLMAFLRRRLGRTDIPVPATKLALEGMLAEVAARGDAPAARPSTPMAPRSISLRHLSVPQLKTLIKLMDPEMPFEPFIEKPVLIERAEAFAPTGLTADLLQHLIRRRGPDQTLPSTTSSLTDLVTVALAPLEAPAVRFQTSQSRTGSGSGSGPSVASAADQMRSRDQWRSHKADQSALDRLGEDRGPWTPRVTWADDPVAVVRELTPLQMTQQLKNWGIEGRDFLTDEAQRRYTLKTFFAMKTNKDLLHREGFRVGPHVVDNSPALQKAVQHLNIDRVGHEGVQRLLDQLEESLKAAARLQQAREDRALFAQKSKDW